MSFYTPVDKNCPRFYGREILVPVNPYIGTPEIDMRFLWVSWGPDAPEVCQHPWDHLFHQISLILWGSLGSLDSHAPQRHNKVPVIPGNSWGSQQPDIPLRCLGFLGTIGKPFSKFWRSCVSPLITMVYVTHLFFGVLISSFWCFTPIASLVWCKWCKWIWWCVWCSSTLV